MTENLTLSNAELIQILSDLEQSICNQRKENQHLYVGLDQDREALQSYLYERESFIHSIKFQGEQDVMACRQAYSKIQLDFQAELQNLRTEWANTLTASQDLS